MENKRLLIGNDHYRLIHSKEQIRARIIELAQEIKHDYSQRTLPPILLFVLTGGIYFGKDLSGVLDGMGFTHHIDTIGLKRYNGDSNGGEVKLISQPHASLSGRDVIIIEDVIDEGITMNYLDRFLKIMPTPPASISYAALLLRDEHGPLEFDVKYIGFPVGPGWVVGCGMDAEQAYRGLLDIFIKE